MIEDMELMDVDLCYKPNNKIEINIDNKYSMT